MRVLSGICLAALVWAALARPAEAHELLVADLVKDCTESMTTCNEDFVLNDLLGTLMIGACGPEDPLPAEQEAVAWLARHPDEEEKDVRTAIADAKHALWSCTD